MRKRLWLILVVTLLLALSGCKKSNEAEAVSETKGSESEIVEEQLSDTDIEDEQIAEVTAPEEVESEEEDVLDFDVQTEEDLMTMLIGNWEFYDKQDDPHEGEALGYEPRVRISFEEGGTFSGIQSVPSNGEYFSFEGKWEIGRLFREDHELPDCLTLEVTSSENPAYKAGDSWGDYVFDNFGILFERYAMGLRRVSPNGSIFGSYKNPILYKGVDSKLNITDNTVDANVTANGNLWRVEYEDAKTIFYISNFSRKNTKIDILNRYEAFSDEMSDYPFYYFEDGFYPVKFTTDDKGMIVDITRRPDALDKSVEEFYANSQIKSKITGYDVKRVDYSKNGSNNFTVEAFFDRPIFGGKDKVIRELNNEVTDLLIAYGVDIHNGNMDEMIEDLEWMASPGDKFQFGTQNLDFVHYNEQYVSLAYHSEWFMGGVYNQSYTAINKNLQTGEAVSIDQVMDMSMDAVKDCIADKLVVEWNMDKQDARRKLDGIDDFVFWFDDTYVYVGFGSYELEMGTSFGVISMEY